MPEEIRFEDAGLPSRLVLEELARQHAGDIDWRGGRAPLYVFSATQEVQALGQAAFNEFFSENALGARRAFPSLMRMEREVIGMGLDLFHGREGGVGNMTSGGTESIVMAVKAARDCARKRSGNAALTGNVVLPLSAHPAFDKGCTLMDIEMRRIPLTSELVADAALMERACDDNTLMLVGSVPCFPYGTIDPIAELAAVAKRKGIWLHVDACVGGWMAPFVREIGREIPAFDFAIDGVMSLSADLHKFGFCPKPASTIFYRSTELQVCQEFVFDVWPSGRFATQTLVGTRPGGAVASAWAVLRHLGRDGYRKIAAELMAMRDAYLDALLEIPGMKIRGKPALANIAFGCDDVDMGKVATLMSERGWLPGMVRTPPSLHLMLSLHHAGAREAYVKDVAAAIKAARAGDDIAATSASYG